MEQNKSSTTSRTSAGQFAIRHMPVASMGYGQLSDGFRPITHLHQSAQSVSRLCPSPARSPALSKICVSLVWPCRLPIPVIPGGCRHHWKVLPFHFTPRFLRRTQIEEVAAAVLDAGRRLADAGWEVEELEDTPPLHEADEVTFDLWFGDGFAGQAYANREWNTLLIRKYMTLCSTFTSVCRICTCQIPPKGAFTDILSSDCQVHLIPLRSSLDPISLSIVESDCFQIIL
jgi:hypothetical protein